MDEHSVLSKEFLLRKDNFYTTESFSELIAFSDGASMVAYYAKRPNDEWLHYSTYLITWISERIKFFTRKLRELSQRSEHIVLRVYNS